MATTRIKKRLTAIPASIKEAMAFLASIGAKQREINVIKRETKEEIDRLSAQAKLRIEILTKERDTFFTALFAFASPRKKELTAVTRSQKTEAGTFGWRWTTPYVKFAEGVTDDLVIKNLKAKGLKEYVRVVEEVDREALLRDRPEIDGISYEQRDEFFAKPKMAKDSGRAEELVKEVTEAVDTLS